MRVIGTILTETEAHRFNAFLTRCGIDNRYEILPEAPSGQMIYQIWVADEDRLEEAHAALERYQINPFDPVFDMGLPQQSPSEETGAEEPQDIPSTSRFVAPVTTFLLVICSFIFMFNWMEELALQKTETVPSANALLLTPVQMALLYDVPLAIEQQKNLEAVEQASYWRGCYEWMLRSLKGQDTATVEGSLFFKIRQGQFWRLFSPCILHLNLLHILFNMIWLWVLGRPIEQRIGPWRTLSLVLVVGIVSNTAQYLVSGPFFLGYSGIVMGQASFIWMREKIAPWEGYPLPQSTILFLVIFILAMFVLQFVSFLVQIFTTLPFDLQIANTAHIVGALVGVVLGRLSFFAWRIS